MISMLEEQWLFTDQWVEKQCDRQRAEFTY